MTTDEEAKRMPQALVERVARAMCKTFCRDPDRSWEEDDGLVTYGWHLYAAHARAAIAVLRPALRAEALEEAAMVCDAIENKLTEQWKAGYKVCDYTQGASDGANDCAAAIRALIKEPT